MTGGVSHATAAVSHEMLLYEGQGMSLRLRFYITAAVAVLTVIWGSNSIVDGRQSPAPRPCQRRHR